MPALGCLLLGLLGPTLSDSPAFAAAREAMVSKYLEPEGIADKRVLASMRATPRHEFVRPPLRSQAYHDRALDIGHKQTISPPFIVAYMTQTLEVQPHHKVLEIGTGSGYQAAVLAPLCRDVYSIEIVEPLARSAASALRKLGYENVHTKHGDGYAGWPEHAPFDRIIVTCSPEDVPRPLVDQLAEGGRLLIPLGQRYQQVFYLYEKRDGELVETELVPTLFVPMTGRSEDLRDVQPDGTKPELRNGSFETMLAEDRPAGWHYQRNLTPIDDAADGRRAIRLRVTEPGEMAQCLQGLALDGRRVRSVAVSAAVRGDDIRTSPGQSPPNIAITFFDSRRLITGRASLGAIRHAGSDWRTIRRTVPIPRTTREAIVSISMNGSVGTLDFDALELTAAE